jgi:hypothetical protein
MKEEVINMINLRDWCEHRFPLMGIEDHQLKGMNDYAVDKIEGDEEIAPEMIGLWAELVVDSLNEIARRN